MGDSEDFKKVFRLAFPERPEEKLTALTEKLRNVEKTDGSIPMHAIATLLYLFSDAKKEENLGQIFNLFDEDGNGNININELLSMMAFFIEMWIWPKPWQRFFREETQIKMRNFQKWNLSMG